LDNKHVFTEGLIDLQTRLDEKFYTSVQSFSEDMSAVFSSVIGFATFSNVGDAEHQLSGVAHSSLTSEQKETKKLAKRIIQKIQPLFDDAFRKESDLAGKPYEHEVPDLEKLLDQRLRQRPVSMSLEGAVQSTIETNGTGELEDEHTNGDAELIEVTKDSEGIHLAPTPEENAGDNHLAQDEAADDAAIAAQFGQDAMHVSSNGASHNQMDHDGAARRGSGAGTAPLTPPRSEKSLLAPFAHGGIPWYMEPFEPVGTTVHDEKWTGRDVMREMSAPLTEMSEDELNGLADKE
jgi:NuA3 HAT complex component NTO1